ncbi:MAG: hypothetical protein Ct9H300mP28_14700 [Pseudomonadota bacterium]|nr:MAG: hypothetical protein Ct9H300mP28_14700 [Pseudomonadota bacterium]
MVEHDLDTIRQADHIIDIGPPGEGITEAGFLRLVVHLKFLLKKRLSRDNI